MNKVFSLIFFLASLYNWLFASVTYSTNTTLTADDRLSGSYSVTLNGNLTLSGAGFTYFFPNSTSPVFVVNNGFATTVTNLLFNDVLGSHFSIGVGSSLVFGTGCILRLLKNDVLSYGWTFSGVSTLDGCGHILDLGSSGSITVQAGGTLTLTNMTLKGLSATNLSCADKTAKIVFDNVELVVPSNYNFSVGSFSVNRKAIVSGGGVFNYQSSYSSTILSNSTLRLTDTVTFKYNPALALGATVASKTNLVFADKTAHLALDMATLRVTTTGMQLTVGNLDIYNRNIVHCDATISDYTHGLLLGKNSLNSDLNINIASGAVLEVEAGPLVYQNEGPIAPLYWGDTVVFQNVKYGFILVFAPWGVVYPSGASRRVMGGIAGASYSDPKAQFKTRAFVSGPPDAVTPGVIYGSRPSIFPSTSARPHLSNVNEEANPGTPWPRVDVDYYMSSSAPISSPNPPYAQVGGTAGYDFTNKCAITKKGVAFGYSIYPGDTVYITTSDFSLNSSGVCVAATGQTFVAGGVTYQEVVVYGSGQFGSGTVPADGSAEWIIAAINP